MLKRLYGVTVQKNALPVQITNEVEGTGDRTIRTALWIEVLLFRRAYIVAVHLTVPNKTPMFSSHFTDCLWYFRKNWWKNGIFTELNN